MESFLLLRVCWITSRFRNPSMSSTSWRRELGGSWLALLQHLDNPLRYVLNEYRHAIGAVLPPQLCPRLGIILGRALDGVAPHRALVLLVPRLLHDDVIGCRLAHFPPLSFSNAATAFCRRITGSFLSVSSNPGGSFVFHRIAASITSRSAVVRRASERTSTHLCAA